MRLTLAVAIAALSLTCTAAASAAPTWLTPVPLADTADAPAVATAPGGDAIAAWGHGGQVEYRLRGPGAAFGDVQALGTGIDPAVGMSDDGTAFVAFASGEAVLVGMRPPGGALAITPLPPAGSGTVGAVRLAVNPRGDALVAYGRGGAFASLRPAGGSFEAPVKLSDTDPCDLRAALGATGRAAVAWHDGSCASTGPVRVAQRPFGGAFPATPDTLEEASTVAVAVAGDGTTAVAYERVSAIYATVAPAGAPFGGAPRVSAETESADGPALAAGAAGEIQLAFRSAEAGQGARIVAALRPPGGAFSGPTDVSGENVASGRPLVVAGGDGSAVASWVRDNGSDLALETARRAAGTTAFAAATQLSAAGSDASAPALAADADGNALTAYVQGSLSAQALDAAGPRLRDIQVRAAGFASEPYPFSFAPVDAWSAVASTAIDFGDGSSAATATATHTYGQPGPKTVTVTATDAVGNGSTAQRIFDVAAALDRTPPVITGLRLDKKRFRAGGRPTAVIAAASGTRFRYTLSEPAQATIFFERITLGRKRGKTCRRSGKTGKRCRIYAPAGLITRFHPVAGPVSVRFTGRIVASSGPVRVVDTTLRPGRYRATIAAVDSSRNISKQVTVGFTILRR